jgi:hypothetical protein
MEDVRCMDYDSMGDCGRFPRIKTKKSLSLKGKIVNIVMSFLNRHTINKIK